jgi:hypothetical protein
LLQNRQQAVFRLQFVITVTKAAVAMKQMVVIQHSHMEFQAINLGHVQTFVTTDAEADTVLLD